MAISREELLRLARAGAVARVQELRNELEGIYKAFPDLRSGSRTRPAAATAKRARRDPGQRTWSAADRKAVSDRMKKYWAARKSTSRSAK